MHPSMDFARKLMLAYSSVCKPLCQTLGIPQTSFDILMFLSNNPSCRTARDIVEVRRIKANLVSVHVDRLVREGYLTRQTVQGDRRKTELFCTEKAWPVVERGRQLQKDFFEGLFRDTDEAMRKAYFETLHVMEDHLDQILGKGNGK